MRRPFRKAFTEGTPDYLSRWPAYFGRSRVLFGRTVDVACGTAHFLSQHGFVETGRFLRGHIVSFKGSGSWLRIRTGDQAVSGSGDRLSASLLSPATLWHWTKNLFRKVPEPDHALGVFLQINGKERMPLTLPWPVIHCSRGSRPRCCPRSDRSMPMMGGELKESLTEAVRLVLRGLRLSDLLVLPPYACRSFPHALGTAARGCFPVLSALKTPVEKLLAEPVMAYAEAQKKAGTWTG